MRTASRTNWCPLLVPHCLGSYRFLHQGLQIASLLSLLADTWYVHVAPKKPKNSRGWMVLCCDREFDIRFDEGRPGSYTMFVNAFHAGIGILFLMHAFRLNVRCALRRVQLYPCARALTARIYKETDRCLPVKLLGLLQGPFFVLRGPEITR